MSTDSAERRSRAVVWRRFWRRYNPAMGGANLVGAVVVFVFLTFVLPVPSEVAYDNDQQRLNVIVFIGYMLVVWPLGGLLSSVMIRPIRAWFLAGRVPDPHERELTLRHPLRQLKLNATAWALALPVFVTLNAFASVRLAALLTFGIVLGGMSTCALGYLLAERIMRPITAVALRSEVPADPVSPGVSTRVLLAWSLGTGIPLLGAGLLALATLTGADISSEEVAGSVLFLAVIGLLFGLFAMRIAARSVAEAVESVRAAQRRVEAGDFEGEVSIYDGSEVGLLQAGFNKMLAGLREREQIREAFGTYLDREVAEHILREGTSLEGEEVEVTMLFVDIRDFTGYAERSTAPEVVATLNRLFGRVVPVIHGHGGHVDKFVGDGLLAVFGAPRREKDHADQALAAALEIAGAVEEEFSGELEIGIGLNSGAVVAGNVGGAGRLEFSVIGDAVNVAARVEAATRQTGDVILVGEDTRHLLRNAEITLEARPNVTLKGKREPVSLYAPLKPRARRPVDLPSVS